MSTGSMQTTVSSYLKMNPHWPIDQTASWLAGSRVDEISLSRACPLRCQCSMVLLLF